MATATGTSRTVYRKNLPWYFKLILITIVIFGTWNPTEYNSVNFIINMDKGNAFNYFIVLILISIWILFIKIVYESMGKMGATWFLFLSLVFIIGMYQQGWITSSDLNTSGLIINILMVLLVFVATMVPVWWRRITGKVVTDSDMS